MRPAPETAEEPVDVSAGEPKLRARDWSARYSRIVASLLLFGCALALPFLLDGYWVFTLTEVMIYAIATIGLDLVFGRAGQPSLAQAGCWPSAIRSSLRGRSASGWWERRLRPSHSRPSSQGWRGGSTPMSSVSSRRQHSICSRPSTSS